MTDIRLNPDLDTAVLAPAFAARRRLHIPNILQANGVEAVTAVLEGEARWKATVAAGGDFFELPLDGDRAEDASKQAWLDDVRVDGMATRMQYVFDTRRLGSEHEADAPDAADAVLEFLNGESFLSFARAVTGDDRIDFVDGQASRYRPGHVLTTHSDLSAGKNRLYAYVLNLTREWRADWGGTLVFHGPDGHVVEGWIPAFNALNLFEVPMSHAVTQVTAFAMRPRLSITGWMRSHQPVGPQRP
jgi:SM-20-related protein